MLTIAHTTLAPEALARLRSAIPEVSFFQTTFDSLEKLTPIQRPDALIVDDSSLSDEAALRLTALKARDPALLVLVYMRPTPDAARRALRYGCGRIDGLIIRDHDDLSTRLQEILTRGRLSTVACVIEAACGSLPPVLARPNLDLVLRRLPSISKPHTLADVLAVTLAEIRSELRSGKLPPPRPLLPWFRILVASRHLADGMETVERIAVSLYASGAAFRHACHKLLGVIPSEVRRLGGLRFAGQRFGSFLVDRRAGVAA